MKHLNYQYDYAMRQSAEPGADWKERLAWRLRRMADRLDRKESFALRFQSDPVLSKEERNGALERGLELGFELMKESVIYRSMDDHLKKELPHLWGDKKTNA